MGMRPLPFVGGSFADQSLPYTNQVCVNYLPEAAESGTERSAGRLRTPPGLTLVATLTGQGGGRGMRNVNGQLFVVQGTELYSFSNAMVPTALGTVNGIGRCSLTHNQVAGGNQVVIVNGQDGYVYDTSDSTFAPITSGGFTGSSVTGFIDEYVVQLDPYGLNWYISNAADALTYDPSNSFQAEADPDLIVTLIVDHLEVWVMGQRTIEQFVATGSEPILFETQPGTVIEMGIGGANTAVSIDNSVYWLGSDGIVYYAAGGYLPIRVSTFAVEEDIRNLDWANAYAMAWTDKGHKVYYITFPDGHTWGYDISQKMWHQRQSYGLNYWRVNNLVYWNDNWYASDISNGNIYRLDWSNQTENSVNMVSRRICPPISNDENRMFMSALQFYMDLGRGPLTPDSYISIRYSDDGGYTWSNQRQYSIEDARNNQSRVMFRKLGSFRNRMIEIEVSANCPRDIIAAYAQMTGES